jgi:flagellar motor protein MotB
MHELDMTEDEGAAPVWPAFGDLMACLFGLFVLFFVWSVAFSVGLNRDLEREREGRAVEVKKREKLEEVLAAGGALAGPLHEGRLTLEGGRIGIGGAVLFRRSSAELQPEGEALLRKLAGPLAAYLGSRPSDAPEMIMVSGFTDDLPVREPGPLFRDNWDLSASRAITVVRALVAAGVPADHVVAAGFADGHPLVPNTDDDARARNRRVEIAPVPAR